MSSVEGDIAAVDTLEGPPVASYREWLQRRWEGPQKKALGFRALDTFDLLADRESLREDELAPIVEAAQSPYFVAWDIGQWFLCRLGARHEVARQAMRALAQSNRANLRGRTLAALHDRLPKSFCIDLLQRGLSDRSKGVRGTAASTCLRLLLTELLPELARAAAAERDSVIKLEMESAIGLMRDTYFLCPNPDGSRSLMVRTSDGVPASYFWPGPGLCPNPMCDEDEAKAIAEELRRLHGRTRRRLRWETEVD
jgi:hypothetical protein